MTLVICSSISTEGVSTLPCPLPGQILFKLQLYKVGWNPQDCLYNVCYCVGEQHPQKQNLSSPRLIGNLANIDHKKSTYKKYQNMIAWVQKNIYFTVVAPLKCGSEGGLNQGSSDHPMLQEPFLGGAVAIVATVVAGQRAKEVLTMRSLSADRNKQGCHKSENLF